MIYVFNQISTETGWRSLINEDAGGTQTNKDVGRTLINGNAGGSL